MKFTQTEKSGITTIGALGVSLVVLVSTGFISPYWLILAALSIIFGIASELPASNKNLER